MIAWEPVDLGCSDAAVRRSPDGSAYAKTASGSAQVADLMAERDKVVWLATTPIPGPVLLDWEHAEDTATLVTSAVRGIPASAVPEADASQVLPAARALTELHALPVSDCPFDHRLEVTCVAASAAVHRDLVDSADFDAERQGRQPRELLAELLVAKEQMARLEADDLVVCHGDACLPNILLDPQTLRWTGLVDLARLGRADRYLDLALLHRSLEGGANPQFPEGSGDEALAAYGVVADPTRLAYYRLLDEFF
ncbi:MAG: aminoglycoside 3'-phosphotransferase [Nocardioides sp.]|uniref:APH(3') family aminoglycoside O-phosphotransferase n=1 Tax=Nocardioides sp. TaxID=35761 RepID=UPI0039E53A93